MLVQLHNKTKTKTRAARVFTLSLRNYWLKSLGDTSALDRYRPVTIGSQNGYSVAQGYLEGDSMKLSQKTFFILAMGSMLMAFSRPANAPDLSIEKVNESIAEVTAELLPQVEDLTALKFVIDPKSDTNLTKAALELALGFKKSFFAPNSPFNVKFSLGYAQIGQLLADPSKMDLTGSADIKTDVLALVRQAASDAVKDAPPVRDGEPESTTLLRKALTALSTAQKLEALVEPFQNIKDALVKAPDDEQSNLIGQALEIKTNGNASGEVKSVWIGVSKPLDFGDEVTIQKAGLLFRQNRLELGATVRLQLDRRYVEQGKGEIYKILLAIQTQDDEVIEQLKGGLKQYLGELRNAIVDGKDGGLARLVLLFR
jgi:hypothetical protein